MDADIRQYLKILRKRWWLIVLALAGMLALAALQTARATRIYEASATVSVGLEKIGQGETGQQQAPSVGTSRLAFAQQLLSTYAVIINSEPILSSAIARAGLTLSLGELRGGLEAKRIGDTQLLAVSYSSSNPDLSARAANAVASAFKAQVVDVVRSQGRDPAVPVEIIEQAQPPGSPISPKPAQNAFIAVVLGLGLAVGLVYVAEMLDLTVKSKEELEELGLPVIGAVPTFNKGGSELYLVQDPQDAGGESFRKLRTSIGFLAIEKPVQVILVTSAFAGEGKTTIALNLAVTYAQGGMRTVLVEADLRRPTLHSLFQAPDRLGLTTAIVGEVAVEQAIHPTDLRNFSVMLAGAIPPNPVELLDSVEMVQVLSKLRESFDIIVLDAPPLVPVADPAALASRADAVLVVARAGSTHRKRIIEAAALVEKAGGRLLGVLLNRLRPKDAPYDYYDYYASYTSDNGRREGRKAGVGRSR